METLFDISNICAGIVLGITVLDRWDGSNNFFTKIAQFLTPFAAVIGGISLILGVIFLFRFGCALFDITGIVAGLTLLSGSLKNIPALGNGLEKVSAALLPFKAAIGIAALVVGIMGLINMHVLC